jgi:hypothetical protein
VGQVGSVAAAVEDKAQRFAMYWDKSNVFMDADILE